MKSNPTPRQFQRRLVNSTEPFFHFAKSDGYFYNIGAFQEACVRTGKPVKSTTVGNRYKALIRQSGLTPGQKRRALDALAGTVREVKAGRIHSFRMKIRGIHSPAFGGQAGGRQIQLERDGFTIIKLTGRSLARDVILHKVESLKWNCHPAIYPEKIIRDMILLLTPEDAIVVDPYMGSGTTGVAAKTTGRKYAGIDINPEYCKAANTRIGEA